MKFSLDSYKVERRAIAPGGSVTLSMTFPPSVNNLFANSNCGGRFPSKQYKAWKDENAWALLAGKFSRVAGPVRLLFEVEDKAGRRDIDNLLKAPLDLLVKHNFIDGDHRSVVREITARWVHGVTGVRITISQAESARAAA